MPIQQNNKKSWIVEDFTFSDYLGNGKFGYVYKAKENKTGKEVAIKIIGKPNITQYNMLPQLKNEIEIHSRLNHPNIIKNYGYFYNSNHVYIVYELARGGNLFEMLKSNSLSSEEIKSILLQIAKALAYLKKCQVLHRDLKLENIMITKKEGKEIEVKITDFGCACQFFKSKKGTSSQPSKNGVLCGTVDYLSPELIHNLSYDFGVDTWALGVIAYELIAGKNPFSGKDSKETFETIKRYENFSSIKEKLSKKTEVTGFIELIGKILEKDASKRIMIEDINERINKIMIQN